MRADLTAFHAEGAPDHQWGAVRVGRTRARTADGGRRLATVPFSATTGRSMARQTRRSRSSLAGCIFTGTVASGVTSCSR